MTCDWPGWTYRWMEIAPSFPAAIASMANFGPVTTSPPANTSASLVWKLGRDTVTVPFAPVSTEMPFNSISCPTAEMTAETFIVS